MARGESWYAVLTRELHTDVNQCVLAPGAGRADAEQVLSLIREADVPAVVSVTSEADESLNGPLASAGLTPEPLTEPIMWCEKTPNVRSSGFAVKRVTRGGDFRLAIATYAAGHGMDEDIAGRVLAGTAPPADDVSIWIAWEGEQPISVVWLTHGEEVGIWLMATPRKNRGRGAARAALSGALAQSWQPATNGAFLWASPAGRPLYESLGFRPVDEAVVWVTPGQEAASQAIGQPR